MVNPIIESAKQLGNTPEVCRNFLYLIQSDELEEALGGVKGVDYAHDKETRDEAHRYFQRLLTPSPRLP